MEENWLKIRTVGKRGGNSTGYQLTELAVMKFSLAGTAKDFLLTDNLQSFLSCYWQAGIDIPGC
jgi:hypothetical protein